jgi:hypothetical protein
MAVGQPTPASPAKAKKNRLTVEQRSICLDYLSRGYSLAMTVKKLRQEQGISITSWTLRDYKKSHKDELPQRKQQWIASLREEPLATPRSRIRELSNLYAACLLSNYKQLCPTCIGTGVTMKQKQPVVCVKCEGKKWVLSKAGEQLHKAKGDALSFETLDELPPALSQEWTDRMLEILSKIREETGDVFSPKEKGEVGPTSIEQQHLHIHAGDALQEATTVLKQLLQASPEHVLQMYQHEYRTIDVIPERPVVGVLHE